MPAEIRLVQSNPNDTAAEVTCWLVEDGGRVDVGDEVVEVETAKAVTTVVTETAGYLKHLVKVSDSVKTGSSLALVFPSATALADHREPTAPGAGVGPNAEAVAGVRFSAGGRQELERSGLNPQLFSGQGLVTAQMVRAVLDRQASGAGGASPVPTTPRPVTPAKWTEIERLTAGAQALESSLTVSFGSAGLRSALAREAVQPSVLAVIVHRVARALRDFPELNARLSGRQIECYDDVNVGVAVDFGPGLRVPVIKHADRMDATEITFALLELMATYHERRLSPADVSGGTVTVSDLSGDDILQFQPRINQDQTLALGIGGDRTLPGSPMTITAVFDHRVSTGRSAAQFLGRLRAELTDQADG